MLKTVAEGVELRKPQVTNKEGRQEMLRTRSLGYAFLDVVPMPIFEELKEAYLEALREVVPAGMRRLMISEVKVFDREVHERIYRRMRRDP